LRRHTGCPIKKQRMMWDYQKQQSSNSFKVSSPFVRLKDELMRIEILPPDLGCTKEAKDVLVDCCVGVYSAYSRNIANVRMDQTTFDAI